MKKLLSFVFAAVSACSASPLEENLFVNTEQCARLVCTDSYSEPLCLGIEEKKGHMQYNKFDYPAIVGIKQQHIQVKVESMVDGKLDSFLPEDHSVEVDTVDARLRIKHQVYEQINLPVGRIPIMDVAKENNSPIMEKMSYESGKRSVLITFETEECGTQIVTLGGSHYQWLSSQIWK